MVCEAVNYLNKLLRCKSSRAVTHRRSPEYQNEMTVPKKDTVSRHGYRV